MKVKFYIAFLLVTSFIVITAFQLEEECDATALKAELKRELRPDYRYDSSKSTRFTYKEKKQVKEIEIPVFIGEKYRFLFHTGGLSKNIEVKIYNKSITNSKRKLLYELVPKEDQFIYVFEPEKSRKMYIEYTIPESKETTPMSSCMIFVLGYQISVLKALD
ncbi:MAG: hypothetical protein CO118_04600 [Flavobacteriales bacterium CG_4_9_14_3_um_filter_32_8]|nr:MAG: hypothetical protein CO118_04600 [Flavobacteriales bacterium CG_4_9_14_3_um_filter_32_8]